MVLYNEKGGARDVIIRFACPDETPELIGLLKKQHGTGYYPQLYDEGFVHNAIQSGDLQCAIAKFSSGNLAGMAGANRKNVFPGSLAFGMLVVIPDMRGFGLGTALHAFLVESIPLETYSSIYIHSMTLDTRSQVICYNWGYRKTGILLNGYLNDAKAKYMAGLLLPLKDALLVGCLPQAKKDAGILYAPFAYAAFIKNVYTALGVSFLLSEQGEGEPAGLETVCTVSQDDMHQYCEIFVQQAGLDFEEIIAGALRRYAASEWQTFNIFINLNDSSNASVFPVLDSRGFFFTGIHPLAGQYEYMIMHYSSSLPVNFETIAVVPDFQEKLNFIQTKYKEAQLVRQN
ncbi:hypothetical protein AGMMS49928_12080 [Spirochaetia bacterium]|nr:hypothetical protein AGMMS49928_12080 [Spirochaetia bacterium]